MSELTTIDGVDGGSYEPSAPLNIGAQCEPTGLELLQELIESLGDAKGGGSWKPVRAADFDASSWGDWEVWEYCKFGDLSDGLVGAIRTGDWVAWNMKTGMHIGFPVQKQAEMLAVLQNENAPTRVVSFDGSFVCSDVNFDALQEQLSQGPSFLGGSNARIELSEAGIVMHGSVVLNDSMVSDSA